MNIGVVPNLAGQCLADLLRWRSETPYAGDQDWIFASKRMKGRQPLWPEAIERNYIRPRNQDSNIDPKKMERRRATISSSESCMVVRTLRLMAFTTERSRAASGE